MLNSTSGALVNKHNKNRNKTYGNVDKKQLFTLFNVLIGQI
jgi:hypothetical protein